MQEVYLYSANKTQTPKLNVWCAFPSVYNFGMSALGFLTVFQHIDSIDGIFAERIFTDTEKTFLKPEDVDILSFSVSFELDYLGILKVLEKYNIPFLAEERKEDYPLIYGGGPVLTANPEPFAPFFDFIMIGDAEPYITQVFELLKQNKGKSKKEMLKSISHIEGVYIPSLKYSEKIYDKECEQNFEMPDLKDEHSNHNNKSDTESIIKSDNSIKKVSASLTECVATPILTQNSFFPNTYIIEVERGCNRNCAFCMTAYINNPIRFCPYEDIKNKIDTALKYTNKIALLGALICAQPQIDDICSYIIKKAEIHKDLEVSVSSLRADFVSDKTLEMLRCCGQKTATIAVEAGSERLRKIINKNLSETDILNVVDKMVKFGFNGLKLYGIIGLPGETYQDLDAFVDLCRKIKQKNKGFILTPAFSTFVPKAQTPFQFAKREDTKILEKKIEYLKKSFAKIGIKIRTGSAKWDFVQTVLSLGSRDLTPYLIEIYKQGGSIGAFKNVLKQLDNFGLTNVVPDINFELPWDFIRHKKSKKFLIDEYNRLKNLF